MILRTFPDDGQARARAQVDVMTAQRGQFAPPQAAEHREQDQRTVTGLDGGGQGENLVAHRRGPLPAPPLPRTRHQSGHPPLRTPVAAHAQLGGPSSPRRASCRRAKITIKVVRPRCAAGDPP
jgi:hypothetical protein